MKKTLALALVLVMAISSVCVLFASAEDVASVNVEFNQDAGAVTGNGTVTLFKADADKALVIDSGTANLRWAYVIVADKDGKITALGAQILSVAQDDANENDFEFHEVTVPAGGFAVVSHHGDNSEKNAELLQFIYDLAKAAGLSEDGKSVGAGANKQSDVSSAGWTAVLADDEKSVTLYKGAAPSTEEPSEDTSSAEPVEVKEEINVDGKLDDTGWTKAEWKTVNAETGTQQTQATKKDGDQTVLDTDPANMAKVSIGDLEYQFAVRADADNVYVAVKVNALPNNCKEADKMDDKVSSGTHFRFYVTPDTDVAAYGKDGAMAVLDTLLDILVENDGSLGIYKSKELTTDATAVLTKTETDSVYEISFKKSLFNIGETFRMATSYSDCHFGTEKNSYNVLNDHKYDVLSQGTEAPWSTNTKYAKYTVADLALGTYTVEPEPEKPDPSKELEEELAGKVTAVEDPDFKVDLTSEVTKNEDGKFILTVVLKLADIKDGVSLNTFNANLHYDLAKMTLLNERIGDPEKDPDGTNFGKVVVDCCGGYDKEAGWKTLPDINWDNLTINHDVDALTASLDSPDGIKVVPTDTINIKLATVSTRGDGLLTKDNADKLELTFTFELKDEQFGGVYVDSEGVSAGFLNAAGQTTNYKGQGDSTVAAYAAPAEESSSSSSAATSSTTPSKPGDAGILIFAVLGIVAIAGAVTVIKVRR